MRETLPFIREMSMAEERYQADLAVIGCGDGKP
jgi:hypothetical protein